MILNVFTVLNDFKNLFIIYVCARAYVERSDQACTQHAHASQNFKSLNIIKAAHIMSIFSDIFFTAYFNFSQFDRSHFFHIKCRVLYVLIFNEFKLRHLSFINFLDEFIFFLFDKNFVRRIKILMSSILRINYLFIFIFFFVNAFVTYFSSESFTRSQASDSCPHFYSFFTTIIKRILHNGKTSRLQWRLYRARSLRAWRPRKIMAEIFRQNGCLPRHFLSLAIVNFR